MKQSTITLPKRFGKPLALAATLTAGLLAGPLATPALAAPDVAPTAGMNQQAPCYDTNLVNGTAEWGFKASFLNYITGPIARGSVETTGSVETVTDANGKPTNFKLADGTGIYTFSDHGVTVEFPGEIHFTGHGGLLDTRFSNIRIEIDSVNKTGELIMHVTSNDPSGQQVANGDYVFAQIDASSLDTGRGTGVVSLTDAPVTITEAGVPAMADFYPAGTELDALNLSIEIGEPGSACPTPPQDSTPEPETTEQEEPEQDEPKQDEPKQETPEQDEPKSDETDEADKSDESDKTDQSDKSDKTEKPGAPANGGTSPAESKKPGSSSKPAAAEQGISSATMTWGLKESFRSYINGPIANGKITVTNGTQSKGVLTFKKASGAVNPSTKKGHISWNGQVRYQGHSGQLDTKLSNFEIQFSDSKTAKLIVDVDAKTLDANSLRIKKNKVHFADIDASKLSISNGTISLKSAPVKLTAAGAESFAGFYGAGTQLDPITVNAKYSANAKATTASSAKTSSSAGSGATNDPLGGNSASTAGTPAASSGSSSSSGGSSAGAAAGSGEEPEMVEVCEANELLDGMASWGIKSSFTTYIRGAIANGEWTTDGVNWENSSFNYSGGTGSINLIDKTGELSLPGSIHFTGHNGQLDMNLSNMRIRITSAQSADLVMDVKSKGYNSPDVDAQGVTLATITGPISITDDSVSADGANVSLTAKGAEAFANFYEPGQEMDPISFSATVGEGTGCSMVSADSAAAGAKGNLAKTGAAHTALIAASGAMVLIAGLVLAGVAGRRPTILGGRD